MLRYCCSKYHPPEQDRFLGEIEPLAQKDPTDGFCEACYKKELEAVEEYIKSRPKVSSEVG